MGVLRIYPEDKAAGMAVVTHMLEHTSCLADVKGSDIAEVAYQIAVGIVRDRLRVAAAAAERGLAAKPPPTPIPGPGVSVPHG